MLWIGVILSFTVSTRETASTNLLFLSLFHSYREMVETGNIEILRSNFMNVILFYPGGLMATSALPKTWPRWINVLLVFLFFLLFSVGIEWFQYATGSGRAEIDDVLHNGMGALLGCIGGTIRFCSKEHA